MGAGKSSLVAILGETGIETIDADKEAKQLMRSDEQVGRELRHAFGADIFHGSELDFGILGRAAFGSIRNLTRLNLIVHPRLLVCLRDRVAMAAKGVVLEAALLPLWRVEGWFDELFWVHASETVRLARLLASRTDIAEPMLRGRMEMQERLFGEPVSPRWTKVDNEGAMEELRTKVRRLGLL